MNPLCKTIIFSFTEKVNYNATQVAQQMFLDRENIFADKQSGIPHIRFAIYILVKVPQSQHILLYLQNFDQENNRQGNYFYKNVKQKFTHSCLDIKS